MTHITTRRNLLAIFAILALSAGLAMLTVDSASAKGNARAIAVTGVSTVGGQQVVVHIIEIVSAGKSDQQVAAAALRAHGARALTASEYSLLGNPWDQFSDSDSGNDFVVQRYNSKDEPSGARAAVDASRATWNAADSGFAFQTAMESTGKCPSLVQECRGAQKFDGNNDIAWMGLNSPTTLGVTWSGTSTDEADVAFNTNFSWFTDGSAYDIETVALHEFGHVIGLGHSEVTGSIMEAIYAGERRILDDDDIAGLQAMYGTGSGGGDPTATPTTGPPPTATPIPTGGLYAGTSASGDGVDYDMGGRRGRDLLITVDVTDGSAAVNGASVSISVYKNGSLYGTGGPTSTGTDNLVTWQIRNAKSGTWTTTVESITKGSQICASPDCPDSTTAGHVIP